MVQRKVPNKLGIKPLHLKLDTHLLNLNPSSPSSQTHEKIKIMKKTRSIKRSNESQSLPPFKKKKTPMLHTDVAGSGSGSGSAPATPQKQSPNYMKSTSSFEARKEQSPKTPITKGSNSRTSSLKMVRSLTKTPSFKLSRSSKKVIFCEDGEAQRATCSSTLKESKFPKYLQMNTGGDELDGTSAMRVCPYNYCSLNGHHHAAVPPLKKFLSARRRALKAQNGFKLACLSPRKKTDAVILAAEVSDLKEESRDLFFDVYSKEMERKEERDLEYSDIDWVEAYCSDSGNDDLRLQKIDGHGGVAEDEIGKTTCDDQWLYDEESVSSGAWSEEDGDSASDNSFQQMKIDQDEFEVTSTVKSDINVEVNEIEVINHPIGDQKEETDQESKSIPDFAEKSKDATDENRTTIIYNIIQFNISVFINGEKTEHSETDKIVTVGESATSVADGKMETEEAMEEQRMSSTNELDVVQNVIEKEDDSEQEYNEYEACSQSNSMDEPAIPLNMDQTHEKEETTPINDCENLRQLTGNKKQRDEIDNEPRKFNLRGPNFLPETAEPDTETVDLKHQMIDGRKNAEEWMVDFALQQAVTKLAPARKRKVALLVEAFEKVMPDPIPVYESHSRYSSKAFTNSRPMQACS